MLPAVRKTYKECLSSLKERPDSKMTDPHYNYSTASSRNIPRSSYSSLANAVTGYPTNNQPTSFTPYYGGAPQQLHASQGYGPPVSSGTPHGYNGMPAYAGTPYDGMPGAPYSNTGMQNSAAAARHFAAPPAQNAVNYPYAAAPPAPYHGQSVVVPDHSAAIKQCDHCHTTSTPLWRRDPDTQRILCNACGLFKQQRRTERPKILIEADDHGEENETFRAPPGSPECSHCHTQNTSVWRRSKEGERLCNACGCWQRLHNGAERPLALKSNRVKPRVRT
ncbi:hypothetical protein B0H16DRAFT_1879621 [Mycena metata]|uniref:GATA-type domain-containing protein n=1 Tax=Mycena metata TaxID=1033252 RepID=A0AAD7K5M0_9AGAR|nr:hypothetical protein B0H16DRAFT_1879621 [Mycena metata]